MSPQLSNRVSQCRKPIWGRLGHDNEPDIDNHRGQAYVPYGQQPDKCAMASTAFLISPEALVDQLARESRSERMEQRVKPSMKQAIEFAAALSGTDTSEFVSTAAFKAAMDRVGAMRRTKLDGEDAARFFAALDRETQPNEAMRTLMAEHDKTLTDDGIDCGA